MASYMPTAHGSETVTISTSALRSLASSRPLARPLSASSDPSVAIRMRLYMVGLRSDLPDGNNTIAHRMCRLRLEQDQSGAEQRPVRIAGLRARLPPSMLARRYRAAPGKHACRTASRHHEAPSGSSFGASSPPSCCYTAAIIWARTWRCVTTPAKQQASKLLL